MSLKWIFWTGLLAILVFFGVIYFGIKNEWVGESRPTTSASDTKARLSAKPIASTKPSAATYLTDNTSGDKGNGVDPELIDEIIPDQEELILGATDLTIDQIVSECQKLSEYIGVPLDRLEQSVSECVDRNSTHLVSDESDDYESRDERAIMIREQCNVAITQKDLLSDYEVKMLVDECVASMSVN